MIFAVEHFKTYDQSIPKALNKIGLRDRLHNEKPILLKPNLVNTSPHPVTTSAACCEAIIDFIRSFSTAEIVIAEGTGDRSRNTHEIFRIHGYTTLADRRGVPLIDLNEEPLRKMENNNALIFPEIYLPKIAFTHFIVSVPVLKAHSLAVFTGTLKNMMGFAPPQYYGGGNGGWKKSAFHRNMQQSLIELAGYRKPDLTIMDASVGLIDHHLGGRRCRPPVGKIMAGYDPLSVDRKGAEYLGIDWLQVPHLATQY